MEPFSGSYVPPTAGYTSACQHRLSHQDAAGVFTVHPFAEVMVQQNGLPSMVTNGPTFCGLFGLFLMVFGGGGWSLPLLEIGAFRSGFFLPIFQVVVNWVVSGVVERVLLVVCLVSSWYRNRT